MKELKIATSASLVATIETLRQIVRVEQTDYTDVAAVVVSVADVNAGILARLQATGFDIPTFVAVEGDEHLSPDYLPFVSGVFALLAGASKPFYMAQLEAAADAYEQALLPPFFKTLKTYVEMENSTFACPGHQGGEFFRKHPAGRQFFDFYGETLFRSDMCNADVKLGDLLIHEGSAKDAQKHAARVFNADKTYFVLNGTSAANKVVTNALLTRGDLVLFDRNNHKSNHHGALIQAGATPVYLET
ncbi:Orn/Lys/Arg decarboxylase N-terminal domain-containing protein, partial [Serratia marcescens]